MKMFNSSVWGMEVVVATDDNNLITNVTSDGEQMNTGFTNEDGEFECWTEGEFEELVQDLEENYGEKFSFVVGAFMKVFTKREEVVAYLGSVGKDEGLARALLHEFYNMDGAEDYYKEVGMLARYNDDDVLESVTMTEEEAVEFYDGHIDYISVEETEEGNVICLDGDPIWNRKGEYLDRRWTGDEV